MNKRTDSFRFEEEILDDSSSLCEDDFNSEDAYCEDISSGGGPPDIEIVGMDLLLQDKDVESDILDDSDRDVSEIEEDLFKTKPFDSLVLTKERLPHLVLGDRNREVSRRKQRHFCKASLPGGEVDSLVLARERMPELIHIDECQARLKFHRRRRGLMGEVDSLELDRRRLPHLVHVGLDIPETRSNRVTEEEYCKLLSNLDYQMKLGGERDGDSTSATEIESDSDTLASTDTVDSLILTRKRLASHQPRQPYIQPISDEDDLQTLSTSESRGRKLPPKTDVGLGLGICRTSSGARAA